MHIGTLRAPDTSFDTGKQWSESAAVLYIVMHFQHPARWGSGSPENAAAHYRNGATQ